MSKPSLSQERQAAALRDNLHRRKAQQRNRLATPLGDNPTAMVDSRPFSLPKDSPQGASPIILSQQEA